MYQTASVIIPTHRRPNELALTLDALIQQKHTLSMLEILVVEDAKDMSAEPMVKKFASLYPNFRYLKNPFKGRSSARNFGIQNATGELALFIGDDIIVERGWLEAHIKMHEQKKVENRHNAVIGHTTWYPKLHITRYMKWLENGGPLLDFRNMNDGCKTDTWHFYTGNISIPTELLKKECFNDTIDMYGWEDIELGHRLEEKYDLALWYAKNASAYHNHEYSEKDFKTYAENLGLSAYMYQKNNPTFKVIPTFPKKMIFGIIATLPPVLKFINKEWYWYALFKKYFLRGLHDFDRKNTE